MKWNLVFRTGTKDKVLQIEHALNTNQRGFVGAVFIIVFLLVLGVGGYYLYRDAQKDGSIDSFAECAAAGNPIMESYPEQCNADGRNFVNPNQSFDQPE